MFTQIPPLDRPTFPDIVKQLLLIVQHRNQSTNSDDIMETIQPQPSDRLSFHSVDGRPRSRSHTPDLESSFDRLTIQGKETTV